MFPQSPNKKRSKVPSEHVRVIRRAFDLGVSTKTIHSLYDYVTHPQISAIAHRRQRVGTDMTPIWELAQ